MVDLVAKGGSRSTVGGSRSNEGATNQPNMWDFLLGSDIIFFFI